MSVASTRYANEAPEHCFCVSYIINETGAKLIRSFASMYQARKFVNRLRHSRRCTLVDYPLFD